MPREAPVTSAMRSARGGGMSVDLNLQRYARARPDSVPGIRPLGERLLARKIDCRAEPGNNGQLARFSEQRQLPRRVVLPGLVGERRRIVAGEAVVGELWTGRVACAEAHGAIDAVD